MMEKKNDISKCSVSADGQHVTPCKLLTAIYEENSSPRKKGIIRYQLHNVIAIKPTRTFFIARLGDYKSNGLCLNFCPFCGEKIDSPFTESVEQPES